MNLSEQVMGDEAAWAQAWHEIELDRQRKAEEVRRRIELGTATVADAEWLADEYGLTERKWEK